MAKLHKNMSIVSTVVLLSSSLASAQGMLGEIIWTGANFCPTYNTVDADGRSLQISDYTYAFSIMRNDFGGDGMQVFEVPDLRVAAPVGTGLAEGGNSVGRGQRFGGIGCPEGQQCGSEYQSFVGLTACVVVHGNYPPRP